MGRANRAMGRVYGCGGTGYCSGCFIVVAGASGALDGDALETGGTTYMGVPVDAANSSANSSSFSFLLL